MTREAREDGGLEGRSALVTGASRGIGEATARALASAGADVWLLARSAGRLEELAVAVGGHAVPADVGDASLDPALEEVGEAVGGAPDVVVNAAGVFDLAPVRETGLETLDEHWRVNVRGPFRVIRAFLPGMLRRGSGTVVSIGSVAGRRPLPGNAAYGASKYALRGLHEILTEELRGSGVRATLVEPAATDTPLWDPLDPDADPDLPDRDAMLRPRDVAEAVLHAATRPAGVRLPLLQIEGG